MSNQIYLFQQFLNMYLRKQVKLQVDIFILIMNKHKILSLCIIKYNQMKQMLQINGFSQQEAAHSIPINSVRHEQDHHKISQSLIQKCLKSMIKQKMSGCLINMQRKKKINQLRDINLDNNMETDLSGLNYYLNSSVNKKYKFNPKINAQSNLSQNQPHHIRKFSAISNINQKRLQSKYRYALNQTQATSKKQSHRNSITVKLTEMKKNGQVSFISAIQHSDDENFGSRLSPNFRSSANTSPVHKIRGSDFKLPKIKKEHMLADSKRTKLLLSPNSLTKTILKKTVQQSISEQFWRFLTIGIQQIQSKRRKTSMSMSDINQSVLASSIARQKKAQLIKSIKPSSTREKITNYFRNLPLSFQRLIQFVVYFFQIKIPLQVTPLIYSNILEELKNLNGRVWSVVAFVFWDINKDGVLNSNNIFNIFKQINNINQSQINKNTLIGENQTNTNKSQENTTPIQQQNQKGKQQKSYKQNAQQLILNLQNIKKAFKIFNKQLERLNQLLGTGSYTSISAQQIKQQQGHAISYLEQIVLSQPNLKYKDVLPLFSAGQQKTSNNLQHKLQLFPKQLTVKCSSSYKQCFIATEHNQQTRIIREKIQTYKQQLKQKRQKRNRSLEQKVNQNYKLAYQLSYTKVAESQMGQTIKQITLNILGYQF